MFRFLVVLLLPSVALAHDCNQFFRAQHHQRQQIVVQHVNYFVGAPIRVEAIVERKLRKDPDWQAFQEFKAFRAGQRTAKEEPVKTAGLLKSNCGRCHTGSEPAASLILDGTQPIENVTVTKILSWLGGVEKPAGETMPGIIDKVKDQDKPTIMTELLTIREKK